MEKQLEEVEGANRELRCRVRGLEEQVEEVEGEARVVGRQMVQVQEAAGRLEVELRGRYSSKDPECPFREDKKYFSKLRKPFQKWHYRKVFLAKDQKYFSVTKITFLLLEILFWISNKVPLTPMPIFTFLGSPKKNCTKNTFSVILRNFFKHNAKNYFSGVTQERFYFIFGKTFLG